MSERIPPDELRTRIQAAVPSAEFTGSADDGYNNAAGPIVYSTLAADPNQPPAMVIPSTPKKAGSDGSPMSANLKFVVPADAKLFVDGRAVPGTGTERLFYTPPLAAGKYFYDVKAELVVDGKMMVEEKRVVVDILD